MEHLRKVIECFFSTIWVFGEKSVLRLFHIQVFCPLVPIYRIFLLCTSSLILLICLKSSSFCRTVQNICTSSLKPALSSRTERCAAKQWCSGRINRSLLGIVPACVSFFLPRVWKQRQIYLFSLKDRLQRFMLNPKDYRAHKPAKVLNCRAYPAHGCASSLVTQCWTPVKKTRRNPFQASWTFLIWSCLPHFSGVLNNSCLFI